MIKLRLPSSVEWYVDILGGLEARLEIDGDEEGRSNDIACSALSEKIRVRRRLKSMTHECLTLIARNWLVYWK
jgi:hypothetical protein